MKGSFANRTLFIAALVIIASSIALDLVQPWPTWRIGHRSAAPTTQGGGRPADAYQVQIMAPEVAATQPTTTVRFRIVNRGEVVTKFGLPVERAVRVAVARRGTYAVQQLPALFSTTTGSFSVPVDLAEPGTYRFVIDFMPTSGTPIRRFGDLAVGS